MENTKYKINNTDLISNIYELYSVGDTQVTGYTIPVTGYVTATKDLGQIFQKYTSGTKANASGYRFNLNNTSYDLSDVFKKYDGTDVYNNSNGTERIITQYNKLLFNWTAPTNGTLEKFTLTASGGLNNGGYVVSSIYDNVGSSYWSLTAMLPTIETRTYVVNRAIQSGITITLDWSTMETWRYLEALYRTDNIPAVIMYFRPS